MKPIPIERARELFDILPCGTFVYRIKPCDRIAKGEVAGTVSPQGYLVVSIDGTQYLAHRVAWAMRHGKQPPRLIDHADLDGLNNREENLRAANKSTNGANCGIRSHNTSGLKGASFCKATGRWRADITVRGKRQNLGRFDTPEEAHAAWFKAAKEAHGEFARAA